MTINEYTTAGMLLAENYQHHAWGPGPWFILIPIAFWTTVVILILVARRRFRGRSGEATLRDHYAKGDISESDYRSRLAVLRETRR
ncbi:hypothetical protein [Rhodococcus sp. NPDC058521]|uniref:hypothetical protein n=1 Tax=Rhodococcus sp. NPDC058521 TaxID=3346536 RepID=UPI003666B982